MCNKIQWLTWLFSLCPQQYEDTCKLMNKSGGSEMVKTGSQVLDSICISEAEKQAVLTLIREEVHTLITLIQHEVQFAFSVSVPLGQIFLRLSEWAASPHGTRLFSDHHKRGGSQRLEEEVWGQQTGSRWDEVRTRGCLLFYSAALEMEKCPLLTWTGMDCFNQYHVTHITALWPTGPTFSTS